MEPQNNRKETSDSGPIYMWGYEKKSFWLLVDMRLEGVRAGIIYPIFDRKILTVDDDT